MALLLHVDTATSLLTRYTFDTVLLTLSQLSSELEAVPMSDTSARLHLQLKAVTEDILERPLSSYVGICTNQEQCKEVLLEAVMRVPLLIDTQLNIQEEQAAKNFLTASKIKRYRTNYFLGTTHGKAIVRKQFVKRFRFEYEELRHFLDACEAIKYAHGPLQELMPTLHPALYQFLTQKGLFGCRVIKYQNAYYIPSIRLFIEKCTFGLLNELSHLNNTVKQAYGILMEYYLQTLYAKDPPSMLVYREFTYINDALQKIDSIDVGVRYDYGLLLVESKHTSISLKMRPMQGVCYRDAKRLMEGIRQLMRAYFIDKEAYYQQYRVPPQTPMYGVVVLYEFIPYRHRKNMYGVYETLQEEEPFNMDKETFIKTFFVRSLLDVEEQVLL